MRKYIFGLILISMIFLTACENVDVSKISDEDLGRLAEKVIVCNEPYIRFGTSCCLDQNNNNVCDKDETKSPTLEKESTPEIVEQEQPQTINIEKTATKNDLNDYPDFFIKDNTLDALLIVGDNAPAEDVIGISDIGVSLQFANQPNSNIKIDVGATKLTSEVSDIYEHNAILVGTPEINKFVAEFITDADTAMIKLFEYNGNIYVVVTGSTPAEVRDASKVLADYRDYDLKGTSIQVRNVDNVLVI